MLVANGLAQSQALLAGKPLAVVRAELAATGMDPAEIDRQAPHRVCPGDRPSTTLLLPELNARRLGQLLALYEHRTFVEGVLSGINSFDQWGVELGKVLAQRIIPELESKAEPKLDHDSSTNTLITYYRKLKGTS